MKKMMGRFISEMIFLFGLVVLAGSCTGSIPVREDNLITVSRMPKPPSKVDKKSLSIHWFGTSNYLIRLEDISVITDPFVSYQGLIRVISSGYIYSDPELVRKFYEPYKELEATYVIFIGHSHYDHMLDTVGVLELFDHRGCGIPVYGSKSARNILHGYRKFGCISSPRDTGIENRWSDNFEDVEPSGKWVEIFPQKDESCKDSKVSSSDSQSKLCYKAIKAEHAPHLPSNIKLFSGKVVEPLDYPPSNAYGFREGQTYAYIFNLMSSDGKKTVSWKVALIGASTDMTEDLQKFTEKVDVLILSVPGWNYKEDYPKKLIEAFKPKYIILSHYDDFFEAERSKRPVEFVKTVFFQEFLLQIQDDINSIPNYQEFEKILIPDVNSTLYFNK